MPVPAFTDCGLLPPGVHPCSIDEAAEALCSNDHRVSIWNGFLQFLEWCGHLPAPTAYLVDGSYVTDKLLPRDVDVVLDISGCSAAEQTQWIEAWNEHHEFVKATFGVDFYPFVVGAGNDFSAFFQYVRVEEALKRGIGLEVRKGILSVAA